VSSALTERLPPPYLRACRPCAAVHVYEQPFRLAALRAGLELVPDTSPPVLRRIDGWDAATAVPAHLDPIRALLHLLGPATPADVAAYLDAPVRTVRRHWPEDAVEVVVDGGSRGLLAEDVDLLRDPPPATGVRGCWARSVRGCRSGIGSCWSPTLPAARRSGRSSAVPGRCSSVPRWWGRGGRGRAGRRSGSASSGGTAQRCRPAPGSRRSATRRTAGSASPGSPTARDQPAREGDADGGRLPPVSDGGIRGAGARARWPRRTTRGSGA
jgi:hypothetical protein